MIDFYSLRQLKIIRFTLMINIIREDAQIKYNQLLT